MTNTAENLKSYTFKEVWALSNLSSFLTDADQTFLKNVAFELPEKDSIELIGYFNFFKLQEGNSIQIALDVLRKIQIRNDPASFLKNAFQSFYLAGLFK